MSHSLYDNRHYVIIPSGCGSLINFNEVLETSMDTLRYSVDGTLTFVKYEGEMPASVAACSSKSAEYSYDEIIDILSMEPWISPSGAI